MYKQICMIFISFLFLACNNPVFNKSLKDIDINAPVIFEIYSDSLNRIIISTDENAVVSKLALEPDCGTMNIETNNNSIRISLENEQLPGHRYILQGCLEDQYGNSNNFIYDYYSPNPQLPELLINEFTSQGSSTHPDLVEIIVKSPGNLSGACIYEGTRMHPDNLFVFPDINVSEGDFILVHFKPQNIEEEINETVSTEESGGLDASSAAWDFWVENGDGLSGNNSCICIYTNPYGNIMDAVIYSNRTSESDENYRGFGSLVNMENADEIHKNNHWISDTELIKPEDAVSSEFTTSTRSICRSSLSFDSNNRNDWHTVPTRGSSFGEINTDEVYQ